MVIEVHGEIGTGTSDYGTSEYYSGVRSPDWKRLKNRKRKRFEALVLKIIIKIEKIKIDLNTEKIRIVGSPFPEFPAGVPGVGKLGNQ